MLASWLLFLVASSGGGPPKIATCDLIEFNRCEGGGFSQVIFWRWNQEYGRYDARGYCMADEVEQIDSRRIKARGYIVSGRIWHTTTANDPERENAKLLSPSDRVLMPWDLEKIKKLKAGFQAIGPE
jgi:hypothetical protein